GRSRRTVFFSREIMTRRLVFLAGASLSLAACASASRSAATAGAAPPSDGAVITADELRRDLYVFAADSMRGRETGTADVKRAAAFLASRLQRLGLEPAGDSMYM